MPVGQGDEGNRARADGAVTEARAASKDATGVEADLSFIEGPLGRPTESPE